MRNKANRLEELFVRLVESARTPAAALMKRHRADPAHRPRHDRAPRVVRILRIWWQTLVPSAITMTLYFVIFGSMIGSRIGEMDGFGYMEYIVPGLIMMAVITNCYGNISSTFFGAKFRARRGDAGLADAELADPGRLRLRRGDARPHRRR